LANQIEDVIYSRLQAISGVTNLVSTRVYPVRRPADAALPLIVYEMISEVSPPAMSADPGIVMSRFRFSCQADTPENARAVAAQVKSAIGYYRDATTTPVVDGCLPEGSSVDFVLAADLFSVEKDFSISYRE
jgi:hypothetical protein|tara:strand:+ start:695 stop:1090 length:396 start_codon:yes stop_codon:yes gene_type:complete